MLCPRKCGADRTAGKRGVCGELSTVRAACAVLHRGEEPPISGDSGSGAIFFTGCTLGCSFCQNEQISRGGYGAELSVEGLSRIFLQLQEKAETLNLVTGTHFAPSIVRALELSGKLAMPVVWNGSGYESPETLELIAPAVDIHLPDLKTLSPQSAGRLFRAADYPETAAAAIKEMVSTHPLLFEGDRLVRGVIMRHLVMPGALAESADVLRWFAEHLADRALLSLMVQFVDTRQPDRGTSLSEAEYESLLDLLDELGIEEGFIQETGDEIPWIPDFTRKNPFPEEYSVPIWHCGA